MYLYRKWRWAVTLAASLVALSPMAGAQWRRAPQQERKTPRAVAVLETYQSGERRLIPVSFFYERHYYDASLYRAAPVPFTLSTETVYEVEQFGKPLGTFTVLSAMHSASLSGAEWFGNGRFRIAADPATLAKKRAAVALVVDDPKRPVLHRREGSEGDYPVSRSAAIPAAAKGGGTETEDDPERPRLQRREGSGGDAAQPSSQPAAQIATQSTPQSTDPAKAGQVEKSPGPDADRPVLHRRDDAGDGATAASTTAATSQQVEGGAGGVATSDEAPDHPILRRGKPAAEQGGRDLPEFNAELVAAVNPGTGEPGARGPEPMARQVAVSDAGTSEPQDVIFACRQEMRQQMEAQARELAESELRRMAPMRGLMLPEAVKTETAAAGSGTAEAGAAKAKTAAASKAKSGASAATSTSTITTPAPGATPAATTPALTFEDEQFVPYDLDYNDYATVVFSGRYRPGAADATGNASLPAAGAGSATGGWVVTVIARQDGDKLVKLYSAVSDPRELDLYPEVRLVDAVDPDGYGRYVLLFREQKRDGVRWLLGRASGYELQTLFETAER
jgi:hypothetical protein